MNFENMRCPKCRLPIGTFDENSPLPKVGDPTLCPGCGYLAVFEEDHLRPCTDEENAALVRSVAVRKMIKAIALRQALGGPVPTEGLRAVDFPVVERHEAVVVEAYRDGTVTLNPGELSDLPDALKETIESVLTGLFRNTQQQTARMILETITPEIANHVLASYGHEDASWPSLSVSALISLAKQARESDDEMTHHMEQVPYFNGYLLAVDMMADRPKEAAATLRRIADLKPYGDELDKESFGRWLFETAKGKNNADG